MSSRKMPPLARVPRPGGNAAMSKRREGVKTVYVLLRNVLRFFSLFVVMILGVVAWRKLWIEDLSLSDMQQGELISLGVLAAIAVGLWVFAARVGREIDNA